MVEKYFKFKTDIIMGLPGNLFQHLYTITIIVLILNIVIKEKNCARDVIMFIVFQMATLSWIILAKSHSYVHTHLNYVLWYFGFIQICIYVIIKFILLRLCNLENIINKLIKRENKKYYLKNFIYKICMEKNDI